MDNLISEKRDSRIFLERLIALENNFQEFYKACSQKTEKEGLRRLFLSLCEQEKDHARRLQEFLEHYSAIPQFREGIIEQIFPDSPQAFKWEEQMQETEELKQLEKAMDLELNMERLFNQALDYTDHPDIRFLLTSLREDEKKHIQWIQNHYDLESLRF